MCLNTRILTKIKFVVLLLIYFNEIYEKMAVFESILP